MVSSEAYGNRWLRKVIQVEYLLSIDWGIYQRNTRRLCIALKHRRLSLDHKARSDSIAVRSHVEVPMSADENSISRKVYFFKIEHFSDVKESLPGVLKRVGDLPFDDDGRYRLDPVTRIRTCTFVDSFEYPLKIRFGRTRRDALPQVEREGQLKVLELSENEGLIDISHIMVFGDGFVAAEWNHEGPKLSQLSPYLFEKGRINNPPRFLPLMERNIVDVISGLVSVNVLEIQVPPDAAELAREADESLFMAIKAAESLGASKKISIGLTAEKGGLKLKILAQRFADIFHKRPHEKERVIELVARGYDGVSKIQKFVDILESKLVSGEIFERSSIRSRSLDSDKAYYVIEQAYQHNLDKMKVSATSDEWR